MTIKVSGSTLTFSDSTTMTTAAAAGPPGPTGPTGPSGPPGPSGSTAFALLTSSTSSSGVASFDFPSVITGSYTKYRVIAEGIYSLGGSQFYPPYLRFYSAGSFDTNTVYGYNTYGVAVMFLVMHKYLEQDIAIGYTLGHQLVH